MNPSTRELIAEAADAMGIAPPELLHADHPTFSAEPNATLYFIGVIGGKDVGKSSLVNALAGANIAIVTSCGEGTDGVLAYAHRSRSAEALEYLQQHVDERAEVVPHDLPHLINQVLLDLPDIDSLHDSHIVITRRALRHLLFPLWAQSVEKYADLAPRSLLAAVAQGNDPANFTFVLTKADQLRDGPPSALRDDYARRLTETLKLPASPQVYLTSAVRPDAFDLSILREKLAREKSPGSVQEATSLATARLDRSVLAWFDALQLDERAARLARLEQDAQDRIADRIGRCVLDPAIAALQDDPGPQGSAGDAALGRRAACWPVVGLVHVSLMPVSAMLRRFASPPATTPALVDAHLPRTDASAAIQTTFAHLEGNYPGLSTGKLWETMPADLAVSELRRRLIETIDLRRRLAAEEAGACPAWLAPWRWLVTVGALIWFPLAQPILEALLQRDRTTIHELTLTVVRMLSVAHLLESITFLIAYFLILYLLIRRGTHRRVARMFAQWDSADADAAISLSKQTGEWIAHLTVNIASQRQKFEGLLRRAEALRNGHQ